MKNTIITLSLCTALFVVSNIASAEPEFRYDANGRVILVIADDGSIISYSYDKHGEKIKAKNDKDSSMEFGKNGAVAKKAANN